MRARAQQLWLDAHGGPVRGKLTKGELAVVGEERCFGVREHKQPSKTLGKRRRARARKYNH